MLLDRPGRRENLERFCQAMASVCRFSRIASFQLCLSSFEKTRGIEARTRDFNLGNITFGGPSALSGEFNTLAVSGRCQPSCSVVKNGGRPRRNGGCVALEGSPFEVEFSQSNDHSLALRAKARHPNRWDFRLTRDWSPRSGSVCAHDLAGRWRRRWPPRTRRWRPHDDHELRRQLPCKQPFHKLGNLPKILGWRFTVSDATA